MADVQTFRNSAGASLFNVDDSGNVTAAGTLTASGAAAVASLAVTGTASAGLTRPTLLEFPGAPQTVNMNDAALELVYGITAGAGQLAITSTRLNVDAQSGGASEDLTIDTTAAALMLAINNVGGEGVVVKSNGGSTLGTIATGKAALLVGGILIPGA